MRANTVTAVEWKIRKKNSVHGLSTSSYRWQRRVRRHLLVCGRCTCSSCPSCSHCNPHNACVVMGVWLRWWGGSGGGQLQNESSHFHHPLVPTSTNQCRELNRGANALMQGAGQCLSVGDLKSDCMYLSCRGPLHDSSRAWACHEHSLPNPSSTSELHINLGGVDCGGQFA